MGKHEKILEEILKKIIIAIPAAYYNDCLSTVMHLEMQKERTLILLNQ